MDGDENRRKINSLTELVVNIDKSFSIARNVGANPGLLDALMDAARYARAEIQELKSEGNGV